MVYYNIQPSTYIRGQHVEAIFLEDDKPKWYKGTVKSVDHYGEDNHGTYVECEVEYEDGEVLEDARFYDCDFENDESLDSWRYSSSLNDILETLDEVKGDIEEMQKRNEKKSSFPYICRIAFIMATVALMKAVYLYIQEDNERCKYISAFENVMRNLTQPR